MKKRFMASVLAAAMVVTLFAGCGGKQEEAPKPEETAEAPAEVVEEPEEVVEDEVVEDEETGSIPQPVIMNKYMYTSSQDDEKTIVSYNYDYVELSEESAKEYPELAKALEDMLKEKETSIKTEYDDTVSMANDRYAEDPSSFEYGPWESSIDMHIVRSDPKVLSIMSFYEGYSGGAHGMYGAGGYNYETQTGKAIKAKDAFSDLDKLTKMIREKLNTDYPDLVEEFDSFAADETLASYAKGEYELEFTFSPCAVTFYFSPYTFASYAAGSQSVDFSYDELSGLIKEDYVPEKDAPFVSYTGIVDVDGDGDLERFYPEIRYDGDEQSSYGYIIVTVDGKEEHRLSTDVLGYNVYSHMARTAGGKVFLMVSGSVENDYLVTTVCDITDGDVKEVGEVWYRTWSVIKDDDRYGSYAMVDPDALPLSQHMDIMSTYYGQKTFKLNDDGTFTSDDPYFMTGEGYYQNLLTTKVDVTVDKVDEDGNIVEEGITLPAGSTMYIYRTDGVSDEGKEAIVDVKKPDDDSIYRMHRTNDYPHKVNGIDEEELFEMLYYAG